MSDHDTVTDGGSAAAYDGDLLRYQSANDDLFELREGLSGMPTLAGHFAVFDQWTEINSVREGRFLERIQPGAFKKTLAENQQNMRVLFNHGKHPQIGELVLGPITALREEERGAYYEVPLYDTTYNRELLPGLADNQYGSSFRFRMIRENVDRNPERSDHNPEGLPERTITEAKVMEFGPVTFPAYPGTTAGLRSATDWWAEQSLAGMLRQAVEAGYTPEAAAAAALDADTPAEEPATVTSSRSTRSKTINPFRKERRSWELP